MISVPPANFNLSALHESVAHLNRGYGITVCQLVIVSKFIGIYIISNRNSLFTLIKIYIYTPGILQLLNVESDCLSPKFSLTEPGSNVPL
jgi:hypothetical protein